MDSSKFCFRLLQSDDFRNRSHGQERWGATAPFHEIEGEETGTASLGQRWWLVVQRPYVFPFYIELQFF